MVIGKALVCLPFLLLLITLCVHYTQSDKCLGCKDSVVNSREKIS